MPTPTIAQVNAEADTVAPGLATANLASTVRTVLAFVGGWLVAKGWLSNEQLVQITGVAVVVVPMAWSFYKNYKLRHALKEAIAAPAGKATP